MLKKTNLCCFSPTGGTRHMGELFCQDISEEMTVTDLLKREENPQQPDSDLTVIAGPGIRRQDPLHRSRADQNAEGTGEKGSDAGCLRRARLRRRAAGAEQCGESPGI